MSCLIGTNPITVSKGSNILYLYKNLTIKISKDLKQRIDKHKTIMGGGGGGGQIPQEEGKQFFFDTRNNGALPLDPPCHECLNVHSLTVLPYESVQILLGTFLHTTNDDFPSYYVPI